MAMRWAYRLADGRWLRGGYLAVLPHDPATEGVATLPSAPDLDAEVHDGGVSRPMTPAERAALAQERRDRAATQDGAQDMIAATLEVILRRTEANWATMTGPQKATARAAIRAEWVAIYKALS